MTSRHHTIQSITTTSMHMLCLLCMLCGGGGGGMDVIPLHTVLTMTSTHLVFVLCRFFSVCIQHCMSFIQCMYSTVCAQNVYILDSHMTRTSHIMTHHIAQVFMCTYCLFLFRVCSLCFLLSVEPLLLLLPLYTVFVMLLLVVCCCCLYRPYPRMWWWYDKINAAVCVWWVCNKLLCLALVDAVVCMLFGGH